MDALALDPVPFEGDDLAEAAPGQQQEADDGDDVRAPELVAGEHGVEPGHLLGREESLLRLHPIAFGVLAAIGVVGAVSPKLGHLHHRGQDRHGAVDIAGLGVRGTPRRRRPMGRPGVLGSPSFFTVSVKVAISLRTSRRASGTLMVSALPMVA